MIECNDKLQEFIVEESKQVENQKRKVQEIKAKNHLCPSHGHSVNLYKNFFREISQITHDISMKEREINELKNSNQFFQYKEEMAALEILKGQIELFQGESPGGEARQMKNRRKELNKKVLSTEKINTQIKEEIQRLEETLA